LTLTWYSSKKRRSFHLRYTCQCCMVWETSEAWIKCSMTMVALTFVSLPTRLGAGATERSFSQRALRAFESSLSKISVASYIIFVPRRQKRDGSTVIRNARIQTANGVFVMITFPSTYHNIDDRLTKPLQLVRSPVDAVTKILVLGLHQHVPSPKLDQSSSAQRYSGPCKPGQALGVPCQAAYCSRLGDQHRGQALRKQPRISPMGRTEYRGYNDEDRQQHLVALLPFQGCLRDQSSLELQPA
jgi:hypothetical protein